MVEIGTRRERGSQWVQCGNCRRTQSQNRCRAPNKNTKDYPPVRRARSNVRSTSRSAVLVLPQPARRYPSLPTTSISTNQQAFHCCLLQTQRLRSSSPDWPGKTRARRTCTPGEAHVQAEERVLRLLEVAGAGAGGAAAAADPSLRTNTFLG